MTSSTTQVIIRSSSSSVIMMWLILFSLIMSSVSGYRYFYGEEEPSTQNMARLYEHRHFRGPVLAVTNLYGCFNFDRTSFNDKVSSIDTRGNCYFLYEDANCRGRWIRVGPGSEGDSDLADVAFNDVASSIRSCYFTQPGFDSNSVSSGGQM